MAKLVFIDFETFGIPGSHENIWQFAYGTINTSEPEFWKHSQFCTGLIDWSDRDMSSIPKRSIDFTTLHTPEAFDWILRKKPAPYEVYSLDQYEELTKSWFKSQGCYPAGAFPGWTMVGRNPEFDYNCFAPSIRESIGLTPFKCQDFSLMYSAMARESTAGRLPSMDKVKLATRQSSGTHHDALMDVKDEMNLTLEALVGITKHWAQKTK